MKEVVVKHGMRDELAKAFDVSTTTIRNALKGRTNSELSRRIRVLAKQKGGAEI